MNLSCSVERDAGNQQFHVLWHNRLRYKCCVIYIRCCACIRHVFSRTLPVRSVSDMVHEGKRWHSFTFPELSLQLFSRTRLCTVQLPVWLHHAAAEESRPWCCWLQINLSVISKLLEWLVAWHVVRYLTENHLLPDLQSAYWACHATETADILLALDSGNLAMLSLFYLPAAFDTVDHHTLLQRLQTYGLSGVVTMWFLSYLPGRMQFICTSATSSLPLSIAYGVSQGSVLGLIFLLLYIASFLQLIKCNQLVAITFADDSHI